MSPDQQQTLDPIEMKAIEENLLTGAINRAGSISIIFAVAFGAYAFTSLSFIQKYMPNVVLADNLWPRILFNSIPFSILSFIFLKTKLSLNIKSAIWAVGMPLVFTSACLIYAWPIMWHNQPEIYLYVHAPNAFIIAISLIIVAPPPRILFTQIASYIILFITPLAIILMHTKSINILTWALNDLVIAFGVSIYASWVMHKLRRKISIVDMLKQKNASSFLGKHVAYAIFNEKHGLLKNRQVDAVVLKIDIRGSTPFANNNSEDIVVNFMSEYSSLVSRSVGKTGGYWNKSIGDGHLITYGAMDNEEDLSDIPGIEDELKNAAMRRKISNYESAIKAAATIAFEFERLKERYDIHDRLSLGMAVDYGSILIRVQGDRTHRKELDIGGRVIYRCTRLEEYTKYIQSTLQSNESLLVVSPELSEVADQRMFKTWSTVEHKIPVRDYPDIKTLCYHFLKDKGERRQSIIKLRAS